MPSISTNDSRNLNDLDRKQDYPTQVFVYYQDLIEQIQAIDFSTLAFLIRDIIDRLVAGSQLLVVGNGGSASTASHMANDIANAAHSRGIACRVLSLADSIATISALANDFGYEKTFVRQLERANVSGGDILLILSVSGSSPNLVAAAKEAQSRGATVYSLVGNAGDVTNHSNRVLTVGDGDYGLTEDLHLAFNHCLVRCIRGSCHRVQSAQ